MIKFQLFLFMLVLEILFHLIKSKPEIKGLAIFDYCYFYSAYSDDATFSLQDTISLKHMIDTFFSYFSQLKRNLTEFNLRVWSLERRFK